MYVSLHHSGPERRRGVVLLAVLIVVSILTLAAFRFSQAMLSESRAVNSYDQANQARLLADAGINYTAALLATPSSASALNGNLTNNPASFQDILVRDADTPSRRGRFSIITPLDPDTLLNNTGTASTGFYYGVCDESGRINLNALVQLDSSGQLLFNALTNLATSLNLTNDLTPTVIWSIFNWMVPEANQSPNGATNSTYTQLTPPYNCKNGPFDSVEELLYVQGMTPALLFGNDDNHNGILSQAQQDAGGSTLTYGLSAYITVYSRELNISSSGQPRIFVNDTDLPTLLTNLTTALGTDLANYIVAYRLYGSSTATPASSTTITTTTTATLTTGATPSGSGGNSGGGSSGISFSITLSSPTPAPAAATPAAPAPIAFADGKAQIQTLMNNLSSNKSKGKTIASLYDLVNSQVTIPASGPGTKATVISSPFADTDSIRQNLPMVLDQLTTSNLPQIPSRININTAPSAVLASIPTGSTSGSNTTALTSAQVSAIQTAMQALASSSNGQAPDPIYQTPAWLLTETGGAFTAQDLSKIAKYITATSQTYRVQSVGHFDGPGPSVRIEAVIDTNAGRPRIIYYRDLTSLGKGYDLPPPQN